jgi:hypothetical protein
MRLFLHVSWTFATLRENNGLLTVLLSQSQSAILPEVSLPYNNVVSFLFQSLIMTPDEEIWHDEGKKWAN